MENKIIEAIKILNKGGIVIYPTDTAFGVGCRIDNKDAIKKLFKIRRRPESQAVPVLVNSLDMAKEYWTEVPDRAQKKLIVRYWPGALTIVLPCKKDKVYSLVRGDKDNIGLRIPNHNTALELIKGIGVPLIGPSANFHGDRTPYDFSDLNQDLVKLVDYVIPGECKLKQASTVIDCTSNPWKILREGALRITL